jgi:hypothetical protein
MICEAQFKCINCQDESKCYENCNRYEYEKNEDAENNFEIESE